MPQSFLRPLLTVGLGGLLSVLLAGAPAVTMSGWLTAIIAVAITMPITGGISAGALGLLAASWAGASWWIPAALLTGVSTVALRHRLSWWWLALGCAVVAGLLATPLCAVVGLLAIVAARLLVPPAGRPRGLLTLLNTVIGHGAFVLGCLALPLVLPVAWLFGRHGRERILAPLLRVGARLVLISPPFTVWRWHRESGLPSGPWVVASNHESVLDILTCLAVPGRPRLLLAKSWVFSMPLLGWVARLCGMLRIDHLDTGRISRAPDRYDVVIFPEGARRRILGRFYSGAVQAAHDTGRPLVALVQVGTASVLPPRSLWIRPGILTTLVISIPEASGSRIQTSAAMRAWFAKQLDDFPKPAYWPRDWDITAQHPAARLRLLRTWLGLWSRQ